MTASPRDDRPAVAPGGSIPVAVTMGDPAGIGPDIALMSWLERSRKALPSFVVYGDPQILQARARKLGVSVAIACNDFSRRRLRQEAGIAVSYGLPRAKALSAITLEPAKALGLDKDVGSIEVGKRADLVLWKGDPLELSSVAEKVFIGGVEQSLVTRQGKLVERYLERVKAAK